MVDDGTPIEVATMKVWPEGGDAKPTYTFFVNERIDLLVREAETFRNDYRNEGYRNVFLALKKPLPLANAPRHSADAPLRPGLPPSTESQIETLRYCGAILFLFIATCLTLAILAVSRQNRRC
jgi:hypothetical protein